jgi:FK506-binding protein 4/5
LSFEKDPETAAEKTILATRHKDEGNAFFKVGKYQEAFDTYQKAIDLFRWTYPTLESETVAMNAVKLLCHLNQAACQLKLKHWASARMCAEKALDVDETNVKARFRRGQAYCGMGEFDKAKDDIEMCLEREPDNADLAKELARIQHEEAAYQKKQNQVFSKMGSMFGGSK